VQQSVRQSMIEELKGSWCSARDLSGRLSIPEKEVVRHLEHVARTLARQGRFLARQPPVCKGCGYVFRKRGKFHKPGKCPRCRHTAIEPPLFKVEG